MLNVTPTCNKVIVKAMPESEVSRGGIILPPTMEKQQSAIGIIQAVGPGRVVESTGQLIPCCVKPGDKVLYNRFVGFPIEIEHEKFSVMPDFEAVIIFNEPANVPEPVIEPTTEVV